MRRLSLAALLTFTLCLPAMAQDTYEARLARAQEYVAQTIGDVDFRAMVATMYQPVIDQLAASGQRLSDAQVAELDALYQARMQEPLRQIMMQQDRVMADLFTLEEINALADFYTSPIGRSVMTKLPQLTTALQPMIMDFVQSSIPALLPEIQRIIGR